MASTNDFLVQLLAKLDTSSVNTEFEALKKRLANDPVIQKVTLDTSMSKQAIKSMASEIHNELGKAFKTTGIESFDITVKDVESILSSAVKESNKLAKELDTASSKAQKFLAQFNNKSGGTLVNSKEFKAVQDAINGLGNTHTIDDLNKAMNTLETTYNNMVSSLRNSGKSLNPFINAKNEMATMDDTIKGIGLEFEKLANKPKSVSDAIKQLSVQQSNVNSHTIGTQEWADAYGKLQQMIQKVKSEISNLQKAQSANVSTQIFNTADLDKQGKVYIQKVRNTIEAIKPELESKLRSAGYTDIEIKGVEKANGQIKSLTATVTDATGAFKQLNFQREKIQGKGKAQFGFVQTDDVKVIGTLSSSVEKVQGNLSTLKSKWEEQSVLVGDFKTKVEQLETSLASVGSKGELNGLKTQIETLKNEASQIAEVNKIQHSTDISDLETKYKKFGMVSEEVENNLKELKSAQEAVFKSQGTDGLGTALENYKTKLAETKASVKELTTTQVSMSQRVSQMTEMQDWMRKNKAATELCGDKIDELIQKCRTCDAVEFNNIKSEFKELKVAAGEAGKLGNTFLGSIKEQASKFVQWFSITSVVMEGVQAIKKMTQEVIAVDSAMVELRKVSDASNNDLKNYFDEAAKSAKDLGAAVSDVISATADWSRLGYSLDDSKKLAEVAILYKNVGDGIDVDTANESLVSTLRGFQLSAEDAMNIVDQFNEVANNFPIDSAGIGEALQRSAASFYEANTDLSKSIALITGTNSVIQDPDSVGTMWKTVSMRIRGATAELEEAGLETEGMVETTSQLQALVKGMTGFDIMKDEDTFKDIYEIVIGIGNEWQNLSDIEQANNNCLYVQKCA